MRKLVIVLIAVFAALCTVAALMYTHHMIKTSSANMERHILLLNAMHTTPISLLYNVTILTKNVELNGTLFIESSGTGKYLTMLRMPDSIYSIVISKEDSKYEVCKLYYSQITGKEVKFVQKLSDVDPIVLMLSSVNVANYSLYTILKTVRENCTKLKLSNYNINATVIVWKNIVIPYNIVLYNSNVTVIVKLVSVYRKFNGIVMEELEKLCRG